MMRPFARNRIRLLVAIATVVLASCGAPDPEGQIVARGFGGSSAAGEQDAQRETAGVRADQGAVGAAGGADAGQPRESGSDETLAAVGADVSTHPPLVPPSCIGLAPSCGPRFDQDCCASNMVPAVTAGALVPITTMLPRPRMIPTTPTDDFRLDNFEVTVGRFRRFVQAYPSSLPTADEQTGGRDFEATSWDPAWTARMPPNAPSLIAALHSDTWTDAPGGNENRPMTSLGWTVADAFCIWDGGWLPTEAEWYYAAAGGNERRMFPWSQSEPGVLHIDTTYANILDGPCACGSSATVVCCCGDGDPACTSFDILPVGSLPKGDAKWGQSDMAGNIAEWTWASDCSNCVHEVARHGGAFNYPDRDAANANRIEALDVTDIELGFVSDQGVRCARPVSHR